MRIAHVSDVHVEVPARSISVGSLLFRRSAGFVNLHFGPRRHHFLGAAERLERTLEAIAATEPDLVVLTGDLTALGLQSEFDRARALLRPWLERFEWLILPGNHDVYTVPDARRCLYEQAFGAYHRADVVEPGRRTPYAQFVGDDLALVVCETARANRAFWDSRGEVAADELHALRRLLDDESVAQRQVFLLTHYAPYLPNGKRDHGWHGLRNLDAVFDVLRGHRIDLWLHGHIHHRYAMVDGETEFRVADPGSGTHDPRQGFNLYEGSPATGWSLTGFAVSGGGVTPNWQKTLPPRTP